MLKYSLGIDVSSKKLDVALSVIDARQTVKVKASKASIPNTLNGFKELKKWIEKHYQSKEIPLVTCMEATGVYHENCALFLYQQGFSVSIILANKAKRYLQSLGLKSKTDSIDAKGLAQMGAEQCLKKWQPLGEVFLQTSFLNQAAPKFARDENFCGQSNSRHRTGNVFRKNSFKAAKSNRKIA